jgi:hypothetical protein
MPNTVNVSYTNTFEEWRIKTNEVGSALGDLSTINSNSVSGEDTVIGTLNNLRTETSNNSVWLGDISVLFDGRGNLVGAVNNADSRLNTKDDEQGDITGLTHYAQYPTLVGTLNSHDSRLDTNESDRGVMANLDPLLIEDITDQSSAHATDLVTAINANTDYIGQIAIASGITLTTTFADVYDGTQTSVSGALNNDYARLNTIGYILGGTQTNGNTSASAIQTALYGTHTNLVDAINGIEDFVLTNSKWDGTDNKSLIWALNNHESRLDTEENNVDLLQGDVGTWSTYENGTTRTEQNITDAIIAIRARQDNLTGDFVNASGDTLTGNMTFTSGGLYASGQYLNLGNGTTNTIRINTSNRVGIGKAAHSSYKVDVSGTLNATDIKIGGESLDNRFLEINEVSGWDEVGANIKFKNNATFSDEVKMGSEVIYNSGLTFTEKVQDVSGSMFTSNTESGGISAVYSDATGKVTLTIADDGHNHTTANIDNFQTSVEDIAGAMWAGNSESGVSVIYQAADNTLDINVNDPLIKLTGDVTGEAYMTNLGSVTISTTVGNDNHNHDGRYYTESEANNKFLLNSTDTLVGSLTVTANTSDTVHTSSDYMQVGSNGSSDSYINFYDDNSNTWRTFKWDDSSNEWQMEDNAGTMRRVYHSGNALKVLNSGGTQLFP